MFSETRSTCAFPSVFSFFLKKSIVQTLKLPFREIRQLLSQDLTAETSVTHTPITLYRPRIPSWRKGALIKTGKLPHISTKARRAGKSLQMMSVQSSPDESSCWWAGWLMPAGSRGPPPEHCHRRCNTYQSETAKVFFLSRERRRSRTIYSTGQSRPRFCPWQPPRAAALAQLHFSRVAITSTFGTLLGRSTLNRLALRSPHTPHRTAADFHPAQL